MFQADSLSPATKGNSAQLSYSSREGAVPVPTSPDTESSDLWFLQVLTLFGGTR